MQVQMKYHQSMRCYYPSVHGQLHEVASRPKYLLLRVFSCCWTCHQLISPATYAASARLSLMQQVKLPPYNEALDQVFRLAFPKELSAKRCVCYCCCCCNLSYSTLNMIHCLVQTHQIGVYSKVYRVLWQANG